MKYTVATIGSVVLGTLLISGAYVQTRRDEQKAAMVYANLTAMSFTELSDRFWQCGPRVPGERYKRDTLFCAEVTKAIEARASEFPAFQVVNASRPPMVYPVQMD